MMHIDYYTSMDPEDLVKCPFNEAHVMKARNLQKHMIKCKMTHPRTNLKQCPYNACHEVPESTFLTHIEQCPDRVLVEEDVRITGRPNPEVIMTGNLALPEYDVNRFDYSDEECWDDDDDGQGAYYQELPQPKTMSKLLRSAPPPSQSARSRSSVPFSKPHIPEWTKPEKQTLSQEAAPSRRKTLQATESEVQDRLSEISRKFKQIVALENRQGDGERLNPEELNKCPPHCPNKKRKITSKDGEGPWEESQETNSHNKINNKINGHINGHYSGLLFYLLTLVAVGKPPLL
ncbi:hypothetical protein CAPTEDRAFT_219364 [Capitella teleta]|uniref:CHHC U11-48K-type domain-containing protein n=1 Tax=Capitella teleta TaxID=283909 RepID=R7TGC2_CAPTE|nr:hypothetical protein CAPTEDRAFT_219364 [Capitella teleta]|eukprot:ELT92542.1 hypothetical protein CAPTEDRAFT_219364 [Capitella teleta]